MTNNAYLNSKSYNTTKIDNYDYINEIIFNIEAISSEYIRFYKKDPSKNYEYPNSNNESIIEVEFN